MSRKRRQELIQETLIMGEQIVESAKKANEAAQDLGRKVQLMTKAFDKLFKAMEEVKDEDGTRPS